jgi:hypothetical protein
MAGVLVGRFDFVKRSSPPHRSEWESSSAAAW